MKRSEIEKILELHEKWLRKENRGKRAYFNRADLRFADFGRANLKFAVFEEADLQCANFRGADLTNARFGWADLTKAELKRANLTGAVLEDAKLQKTNLSGAIGLLSPIDYLERNFEKTEKGYIAYKTFNSFYGAPSNWLIKPGSVICENVNFDRCDLCGCGINVGTYNYVVKHYKEFRATGRSKIWEVLIRFEWLAGVCVPYNTNGKIRCERVELLREVD